MPKVKSVIVIDYYEGIRGLLASRGDFPYDNFLANPRMRTQTEIIWSTDVFSHRPTLLCDLDGMLKDRYQYALKERIHAIETIISSMGMQNVDAAVGELLSKAVSYIDERSVYCGDGNLVVVNWGLIPRVPNLESGGIYRSGKFVGNWGNFKPFSPHTPEEENEETILDEAEIMEDLSQHVVSHIEEDAASDAAADIPDEADPDGLEYPSVPHTDTPAAEEKAEPSICEQTDNIKQENTEQKEPSEENVAYTDENDAAEHEDLVESTDMATKGEEYSWRTFFSSVWKGLKFILRKIGWILVALLLLLATLFFCKGCQGPVSLINPFYAPLPKNPRLLPVEDGAVGMSADGMTQIATDRLNILLEKKNNQTMLEWAKAFKRAYPGTEYEIFYYNEEFCCLQIKVPSEKREQVKMEIKQKLKEFSFDVYDETVFNAEAVSFNDPELTNDAHAWFLNVIGVSEAWNFTLGDPDVIVAVVDNGFDTSHPELEGKIIRPYNVLTQNANLRPIYTKEGEDAHGTHVAATAVGKCNNGQGLLGIAPNCKLMPVQVGNDNIEGCMSNQAILEGVLYAVNNGADVVNISLGMRTPEMVRCMSEGQQLNYISSSLKQEEMMWERIFEKARQRNCIIVFAAGNDNVISGIDPKKRNNATIRVSAVNTTLGKADFSNYGRYAQLNREYSSVSAPGESIFSASPHGKYVTMQGTSMAAPVVAGTVALLKSVNKNMTADQALSLLKSTGREVDPRIGPLIHTGRAVKRAFDGSDAPAECDDIEKQVQKLKAQIDSLCQLCPDAGEPSDTLKYDDAVKDNHGLDGLWKSTTSLVATSDNSPVELYMQFKQLSGTLTIKNQGHEYTAPLTATIDSGYIHITQHEDAKSTTSPTTFNKYQYECSADRKGNLSCKATSETNMVTFNLIRVN